jgi:predicted component of type VI protein secretion system
MNFHFNFDPNRIHWHDGQVLSCHDLQQADIIVFNTIRHLASIISPYSWGVIKLELDGPSLASNVIRINQLECLMPDYTYIQLPQYGSNPIEINLDSYKKTDEYMLYCSISKEETILNNDFTLSRYKAKSGGQFPDMNTNENPKTIMKLMPVITLTTEKLHQLSLPLIKFNFSGTSIKILEYDPPSPNFRWCKISFTALNSTLSSLQEKLQIAINKVKMQNNSTDFQNYGYSIIQELCPLIALIQSAYPNPFQVYLGLTRLSAALSNILSDQYPNLNLYYDHSEIYNNFKIIIEFIEHKIKKINTLYSIDLNQFKRQSKSLFSINLKSTSSMYLYLLFYFHKNFDHETWIKHSTITSYNILQNTMMEKTLGCERRIFEQGHHDNLNTVKVEVTIDNSFIQDNTLCIANYINQENSPESIYLLIE